ncbi:hypothetical protein KDH_41660 [Dictyobacter sp. S3.2.2.5]|uniref:Uncharacterized protein n=1 Tax=Dictyobacter halimunensis TaxID=3026934 RepID=A0ABQ6FY69_9CHLR|nr:hypothetical protein KDH_41660 [Dictyobacter sp. S3.2.2.5]
MTQYASCRNMCRLRRHGKGKEALVCAGLIGPRTPTLPSVIMSEAQAQCETDRPARTPSVIMSEAQAQCET